MAAVDAADLSPGSPADTAWHLLTDQHGIGWVTAGKLLDRKRPRLLPVYDQVVRCFLGRPTSFWLGLHTALRADESALHHALLTLRQRAGVTETVSALRCGGGHEVGAAGRHEPPPRSSEGPVSVVMLSAVGGAVLTGRPGGVLLDDPGVPVLNVGPSPGKCAGRRGRWLASRRVGRGGGGGACGRAPDLLSGYWLTYSGRYRLKYKDPGASTELQEVGGGAAR